MISPEPVYARKYKGVVLLFFPIRACHGGMVVQDDGDHAPEASLDDVTLMPPAPADEAAEALQAYTHRTGIDVVLRAGDSREMETRRWN